MKQKTKEWTHRLRPCGFSGAWILRVVSKVSRFNTRNTNAGARRGITTTVRLAGLNLPSLMAPTSSMRVTQHARTTGTARVMNGCVATASPT
jgi:hypothetical protein